jgi:hypothetical protein
LSVNWPKRTAERKLAKAHRADARQVQDQGGVQIGGRLGAGAWAPHGSASSRIDPIAIACCGSTRIVGVADPTRDIDRQPQSVGAQAGLDRSLKVAALRADARHQKPGIGRDRAHGLQRFGIGRANYQAHVGSLAPG